VIGPFALVVLDMAGTTVRDDGVVDEAFISALSTVGVEPGSARFASAETYVRDTMGQSKAEVFAALLDPDEAARATEAFARAYEEIVAAGRVVPMEGALDMFVSLRAQDVKIALTTGFAPSTRDALIASLGWSEYIDVALSPADSGRGRPAPDMILDAMKRLGVSDAGAVAVVGDTVSDLEAGTNAGARAVVGVLSGAHDRATLLTAPHTDLIDDINGLIEVLTRT
jgi:phosphonatase-like hydrolase